MSISRGSTGRTAGHASVTAPNGYVPPGPLDRAPGGGFELAGVRAGAFADVLAGIELGRVVAGQNHAPVVYFVWCAGALKIGTTVNLVGRIGALYLRVVDVIMIVPGGREIERTYHERFRNYRLREPGRRELFDLESVLKELGITWERPPAVRLEVSAKVGPVHVPIRPATGPLPPFGVTCRSGHQFTTRARGGTTVRCPICGAPKHVPVSRTVLRSALCNRYRKSPACEDTRSHTSGGRMMHWRPAKTYRA
jgi:hypothetical protein